MGVKPQAMIDSSFSQSNLFNCWLQSFFSGSHIPALCNYFTYSAEHFNVCY